PRLLTQLVRGIGDERRSLEIHLGHSFRIVEVGHERHRWLLPNHARADPPLGEICTISFAWAANTDPPGPGSRVVAVETRPRVSPKRRWATSARFPSSIRTKRRPSSVAQSLAP